MHCLLVTMSMVMQDGGKSELHDENVHEHVGDVVKKDIQGSENGIFDDDLMVE